MKEKRLAQVVQVQTSCSQVTSQYKQQWCPMVRWHVQYGFHIHVLVVRVASFSRSWLYKQEVVVSLCFTWSCIAAQSPIVREFPLKFHKKEHPYKNASRVSLRMFTSAVVWHLTSVPLQCNMEIGWYGRCTSTEFGQETLPLSLLIFSHNSPSGIISWPTILLHL